MNERVQIGRQDGIAVVTIHGSGTPVPPLDAPLRRALIEAVTELSSEIDTHAIVLLAGPGGWPGGARPDAGAPTLAELCRVIEDCPRPVVAAMQGRVFGAGLDLALAAHHRVAQRGTAFVAPQLAYGLLPWGGATQRLPRVVGAGAALDLMMSQQAIGTAQAERLGLVGTVSRGALAEVARGVAATLAGRPVTRSRDGRALFDAPRDAMVAIRARRDALASSRLEAPGKVVDCVEAALLLPFEGGLAFEQSAFEDIRRSDQARALCHIADAEPVAARLPCDAPRVEVPDKLVIVGASGAGQGLAVSALSAGMEVALIETQGQLRTEAARLIRLAFERAREKGQITPDEADAMIGRLSVGDSLALAKGARLAFEAVAEAEETKIKVLSALQSAMAPRATLMTKTVYLDMARIAAAMPDGARLVGVHIQMPVHIARLAELSLLQGVAPRSAALALAFLERVNKQPVVCAGHPGLVSERLLEACRRAADICVEEGASPAEVDAALIRFGFAQGVYQGIDAHGVDAVLAQRRAHAPEARGIGLYKALLADGRKGRHTGPGWLSVASGPGAPKDDPGTLEAIARYRTGLNVIPRRVGRGEIQRRCLAAMINEGARMIETGAVAGPAALDVVSVLGLGFPRWKGGPMQAGDQWGLGRVENTLRGLQDGDPSLYTPARLLGDLVRAQRCFGDLPG